MGSWDIIGWVVIGLFIILPIVAFMFGSLSSIFLATSTLAKNTACGQGMLIDDYLNIGLEHKEKSFNCPWYANGTSKKG